MKGNLVSAARGKLGELSTPQRLWVVAAALLFEYLVAAFAFDARSVIERGGMWLWLGSIGTLAPLGIAILTALILTGELRAESFRVEPPSRVAGVTASAVHALSLIGFFVSSWWLFGRKLGSSLGALLWGLAALGMATSMVGIAFDMRALGRRVSLVFLGAIALLGGGAYAAAALSSKLWDPLGGLTFEAVRSLLASVFQNVDGVPDKRWLSLDGFAVEIAPECSGYEGIGLASVLISGYLFATRRRLLFPNALLLLPMAVIGVWSGNVLRLCLLMIVGARYSESLADGAFHSRIGWIFFCAITLGVAWVARTSAFFSPEAKRAEAWENPHAPWLAPLLVLLAVHLVTGLRTNGLDPLYPMGTLAGALALIAFLRTYQRARVFEFRPVSGLWAAFGLGSAVALAWHVFAGEAVHLEAVVASLKWPAWAFNGWVCVRLIEAALVAPVCEELAFRGFLMQWLGARRLFGSSLRVQSAIALCVSSLIFGLAHPERWVMSTVAGFAYGGVFLARGKLMDAVVAHGTTNLIIGVLTLWTGDWQHWL